MTALFFQIGGFSLINDALWEALPKALPEYRWRRLDVERDIVNADLSLRSLAVAGAWLRYGSRMLANRQPPRDFYVRLPVVLDAVKDAAQRISQTEKPVLTFQTQSLFDAGISSVPHFLYTDHTYQANDRYPTAKASLPVCDRWLTMERELYQRASTTFVSSEFARASVIEDYGIAPEAVCCVHSGSNVSLPESIRFPERTGRVILFVGVDWERKGGPELLAAFRQVRERISDAELWIVGCDPGVREDGVVVRGRISREAVALCYEKADVFCLPSRMDPSASVLAEAGAYGLPLVATPVGGNLERVGHGISGFLCDPSGLAGRLEELLRDGGLRERMGIAARARVEAQFTWRAVAEKIAARISEHLS